MGISIGYGNQRDIFFSFKVKFTREIPNDFYISGDQVEGIIELTTNEIRALDLTYGTLRVDLIGELQDFKKNIHQPYTDGVEIFFRRQTKLIPISKTIHGKTSLRIYRWTFHGSLDSFLPSSLPPKDELDPCICYYAYAYFGQNRYLTQKCSFLVFTRTPMPSSMSNPIFQSSIEYRSVILHCKLLNQRGLIVPGGKISLQIELINPLGHIIKKMRVKFQQYRHILYEETELNVFSFGIPDFELKTFNEIYHKSIYEVIIPLEKCRLMAPTSRFKNVRYELQIEFHLLQKIALIKFPAICSTDHQPVLNIPEEFQTISSVKQYRLQYEQDRPPPSYRDAIASAVLPQYHDLFP